MKDEHHQQLLSTFHKLSKAIIIIPIVILMVTFAYQTRDNVMIGYENSSKDVPVTQPPSSGRTTTVAPQQTQTGVKLDLKGPLACNYSNEGITADIYIKNRKIYAEYLHAGVTEKILVSGDCLYRWETGQATGDKTCGVGSYLTLFETLSSFGVLDLESMMGMLTQFAESNGSPNITPPPANQIAKTCVSQQVPDSSFGIPAGITFTDTPLVEPDSQM